MIINQTLEENDMKIIYIPPYTPSANGIEMIWSHYKYQWRQKLLEYKLNKKRFIVEDVLKRIVN